MGLEILLGTLALLGGIGALGLRRDLIGQHLAIWRRAMEEQGVERVVASSSIRREPDVTGSVGPFLVRMSRYAHGEEGGTRLQVGCPTWPRGGIILRTTGVLGVGRVKGAEIETGDAHFDAAFCIGGPPALVHAVFGDDLRRHLLAGLHAHGPIEIAGGVVRVDVRDGGRVGMTALAQALGAVLDIARRVPAGGDLDMPVRLAAHARSDPQPPVRLRNLLVLSREYHDRALTRETLQAACADPYPEVRLRAALALGRERLDVLYDVVASRVSDDTSVATAVYALGPEFSLEQTLAILEHALRTRRLGSAHACLSRLGTSGDAVAVSMLAKILGREHGELAVHAARALAETGAAAEAPLVAALDGDGEPLVVRAAVEALGRCGTAMAVLRLKEIAERHAEHAVRRAARQAVAEIQLRLTAAAPGQLSMAPPEAGRLSLATGEAGRVSLADSEAGRLSLPPEDPDDAP